LYSTFCFQCISLFTCELNQRPSLFTNFIGYEFYAKNTVLAAVETINNGRVWIRDDQVTEKKLMMAALSAALILRTNLQEAAD